MHQIDILEYLIHKGPGRTELQLARALFGENAIQQSVNQDCNMLLNASKVSREGEGGPSDPFRYYPIVI